MTGKTPPPLVPKLRFPAFKDAPEWEHKRIDALARVTQGGTPDTSNSDYWGGPVNWLTPAEMGKDDSPHIGSTRRTLTETGLANCSSELLPPSSVIISTRAPIGHLAINTSPMAINQGCRGLIPVEDAHFLYYALLHAKSRLLDLGAGNTFKELSGSALKGFVLLAPAPLEQQKIADCLGSLDDLIAAEGRKLEALRRHKQGLMQQLFPQPGETVPRLRFPEFEDGPEWRRQTLGQAARFLNGRAYSKDELLNSGKYRVLRVGNFFTNDHWYYSDLELDEDKYCDYGDLLYAWSASFGPRIWRGERVIYHYHLWKVVERKGIDRGFLYACLDCETQRMRDASARGLGMQHLTKAGIESWECAIPPVPDEQKRISECLAAAEAGVEVQGTILDTLQRHKRGLLQQLFPRVEEAAS